MAMTATEQYEIPCDWRRIHLKVMPQNANVLSGILPV
jgi:hypothetical protein